MRARHRHFNPAHAGAAFALDARYGFDVSDNTEVATWEDRTSNNRDAAQSTAAYRPKYRTAVHGGAPSIQFVAAPNSKDRLDGSVTIANNVVTAISVGRLDAGAFGRIVAITKNGLDDFNATSRAALIVRNGTNNELRSERNGGIAAVNIPLNTFFHFSNTFDGANATNRLNESTSTTAGSSGNFDVNQYRVGMAHAAVGESDTIGAWNGYISHVSLYNEALSASMRKRAQFANAFSFKIACN